MGFARVSINDPVFATMAMAALCVLGLFSYSPLRVERLPDISPPIVFALIGGIITAPLLTLIVVPVLYSDLVRERKPKRGAEDAPVLTGGAIPEPMPAAKD